MPHPSEPIPFPHRWVTGAALAVPVLMGVAFYAGTPATTRWLWSEQGPLELSQVLILLFAMGLGLATLVSKGRIGAIRRAELDWLAGAICGLALFCGVVAGEESSWGQHLAGWSTPEAWSELNDQHETNLHNISSWADQKPRAIVELGVIVLGIVWPLLDKLTTLRLRPSWRLVLPPVTVLPVALFAEGILLLERGPELLGTRAWAAFPRPSELQELYYYTFFALCMLAWRQRLLVLIAESDAPAIESLPVHEPIRANRRA
ncbi:MAG: hypothetical protein AB7I48_19445, partial [Planctomycetaceae bacterium]